MSTLYIKILTDYFHHIIGDLEENRKNFLGKFYSYLLEKDEYGNWRYRENSVYGYMI